MRQRLIEAPLPGWTDPADAFASLLGDSERAIWLDSGVHAVTGMSYLASGSRLVTAAVPDGTVTVDGVQERGTILDFLRRELPSARVGEGAGFRLGWVGWLGYELRSQTMGTPVTHESAVPDASLLFVDRAIAFDHDSRTMSVLALGEGWLGELGEWRRTVSRRLAEPAGRGSAAAVTAPTGDCPAGHVGLRRRRVPRDDPGMPGLDRGGRRVPAVPHDGGGRGGQARSAGDLSRAASIESNPPRRAVHRGRHRAAQRVARAVSLGVAGRGRPSPGRSRARGRGAPRRTRTPRSRPSSRRATRSAPRT